MNNLKSPWKIIAIIIAIAFFLPWFNFGGLIKISGYNIPSAIGAFAQIAGAFSAAEAEAPSVTRWLLAWYLVWILPILSIVIIITKSRLRIAEGLLGGIIVISAGYYVYNTGGLSTKDFQVFDIGLYATLLGGLSILLVSFISFSDDDTEPMADPTGRSKLEHNELEQSSYQSALDGELSNPIIRHKKNTISILVLIVVLLSCGIYAFRGKIPSWEADLVNEFENYGNEEISFTSKDETPDIEDTTQKFLEFCSNLWADEDYNPALYRVKKEDYKGKSVTTTGKIAYIVSEDKSNYVAIYHKFDKNEIGFLGTSKSIIFLFNFSSPREIMNLRKGDTIKVNGINNKSRITDTDGSYWFEFEKSKLVGFDMQMPNKDSSGTIDGNKSNPSDNSLEKNNYSEKSKHIIAAQRAENLQRQLDLANNEVARLRKTLDLKNQDTIPAAFHGLWLTRYLADQLPPVGSKNDLDEFLGGHDGGWMEINQKGIHSHESFAAVFNVAVSEQGREIDCRTNVSCEGDEWKANYFYRISPDGKTLTDRAYSETVYYKVVLQEEVLEQATESQDNDPPSATVAQTIPAVFHGKHDLGYIFEIAATSIKNYDRDKYMVSNVKFMDEGRVCVVSAKSTTKQDVITLRQTSNGEIWITSRQLDDALGNNRLESNYKQETELLKKLLKSPEARDYLERKGRQPMHMPSSGSGGFFKDLKF